MVIEGPPRVVNIMRSDLLAADHVADGLNCGLPLGVPKKITTVDFHGAKLLAIAGDSPETTMIAMTPIVKNMHLDWGSQFRDWGSQFRKIEEDHMLATCVVVKTMQVDGDTQARSHLFMPISKINYWMTKISVDRVRNPETRAMIMLYQNECADILFVHFFGKTKSKGEPTTSELDIRTNGIVRMLANKVTVLQRHMS